LLWAYITLLPQLFLPAFGLGFWYRDRAQLWEYAVLFHNGLAVAILGATRWPAACAFTFYWFDSPIDQSRFISHVASLRAGTFGLIQPDNIEGLTSFPSFHVAGALMMTWAFRGRWP
jgi:hypothetical protein